MGHLPRKHAYRWVPIGLYFPELQVCTSIPILPFQSYPAYITGHSPFRFFPSSGHGTYTYYMRKHNGLVIHDAVSNTSSRAHRIRNFNDFAADVNASVLPQWIFITPNMVDDAHDTTIDYASQWLEYWLVPLLDNANFNKGNGSNGTLVVLTFDENSVRCLYSLLQVVLFLIHVMVQNYAVQNTVYTLLLGSAVPSHLKNTT